jgi:hypothetical protein
MSVFYPRLKGGGVPMASTHKCYISIVDVNPTPLATPLWLILY